MKVEIIDYKNIKPIEDNLSLCLGYFDGVHLGHAKIFNTARQESKHPTAVITFDKPVSEILNNGKSKEVLTSLDDRFRMINRFQIDYYLVIKIDQEFLNMTPEEFMVNVLDKLNVKEIFCGTDYTFGKFGKGTPETLKKHYKVHSIDLLDVNNKKVSTSNIISLIKEGNVKEAGELMNHHYQICGIVVHGHNRGLSIGFPTENVKLSANYVIPKYGVYKTIIYISGVPHLAITNVGIHPTVGEEFEPIIETHVPNYESDDYGKTIYVEFLDFIRPERKFESLEALKAQIQSDILSLK